MTDPSASPAGEADHRTGERGAALMLILAFMTVMAVVVAALFYVSFTNIRSVREHRRERVLRYNADAALDATIQQIRQREDLAMSGGCPTAYGTWEYEVQEPAGPQRTIATGSVIRVDCKAIDAPSVVDPAVGQTARTVEFRAYCKYTSAPSNQVKCAGGPAGTGDRLLGSARVRFDPDPTIDDPQKRAVIPKVLAWDLTP